MSQAKVLLPRPDAHDALAGLHPDLTAQAQPLELAAGKRLFPMGGRPEWMHFVRRGEAVLQRMTPDGLITVMQRAAAGAWLAESSLTSQRYHCDGVCRTACALVRVPIQALRLAIDTDAATRWWWISRLSGETRQQRLRTERLSLKSIKDRLRHLIVTEGDPGLGLDWPGTRLELAIELSVTPEALYRALAELQSGGLLTFVQNRLRWSANGTPSKSRNRRG